MAYLIQYCGMTRDEAYVTVKEKRPMVQPNPGFWKQLGTFEDMVRKESSRGMCMFEQTMPSAASPHNNFAQWAIQSSATYATLRSILETPAHQDSNSLFCGGEEELRGLVFCDHDLSVTSILLQEQDIAAVLNAALDFLWDRGVLAVDLQWLVALSDTLAQQTGRPIGEMIMEILKDSESDFCEQWVGEINSPQVERVQTALSGSAQSAD